MARSDSFFIRATVDVASASYDQTSIDLGSFVDALGKTVLRIHNVSVEYGDHTDLAFSGAGGEKNSFWQLTTQSQGALVSAANRSVISCGSLRTFSDATGNPSSISEATNLNPETWSAGYLVAVESIFLGSNSVSVAATSVQLVLECTVETMTAAASMALALSQQ